MHEQYVLRRKRNAAVTMVVLKFLLVFVNVLLLLGGVEARRRTKPIAMFVVGDSLGDTGNHQKKDPPWRPPYGQTWPSKPSGRYSDGRVLTDLLAISLNLSFPLPYDQTVNRLKLANNGVNFAYGGSGVFKTFGPKYPTISQQIDQLAELVDSGIYPRSLLCNSLVLFVYGGNDYGAFLLSNEKELGNLRSLIPRVVRQITSDVRRLARLGFRIFTVTNLQPAGCFPVVTMEHAYSSCNDRVNSLSSAHNKLLQAKLPTAFAKFPNARYLILDQYSSMLDVLFSTYTLDGKGDALRPCCEPIGNASCGDVDEEGRALYEVCLNPSKRIFWDTVHLSQFGWNSIMKRLQFSLRLFFGD